MKRHSIYIVWLLLTFFVLGSCSSDDPKPDPELVISLSELTFVRNGETKSFHIKANTAWKVTSSESWCTLTPSTGGEGTSKVEATVAGNETTSERTATITISEGNLSKQVLVKQSAAILLGVAETEFNLENVGEQITLQVQSSGTYEIDIHADWISLVSDDLSNPVFQVNANMALLERTGTIDLTLDIFKLVITVTQAGQPLTIATDNTGMGSNAMTLASKMKVGWNLGNTLEATSVNNGVFTASEVLWGNPLTTKTLIDGVKAAGFNAVRLPCAWSGYLENTTNYRIKDAWLARVKEVIDYCVANNMYVLLNIHWDGGWLENNPVFSKQVDINKKQKALWEQIAVYFRDYDEHLLFAGTNEVHFDYGTPTAEHITVQQSFNQTFVDAVRSTGGKNAVRNLAVQSYNTNIALADEYMIMPTDETADRLITEVHFYDPYDFTLDNNSTKYYWGSDFAGDPNTSTWGQEAWLDDQFELVKTKFIDHDIPVIIGEYGVSYRLSLPEPALSKHKQSRNYYLNYVNKKAKELGIVTFYWDSGHTGNFGSGLFNRATGAQVYADAIEAIITGAQ